MLDVESVRPELLEYFAEAEVERQRVLQLDSRTDKDFLDAKGNVDKGLKKEGSREVGAAKSQFYDQLAIGLGKVVTSEVVTDDFDKVVLHSSLKDSIRGFQSGTKGATVPDNTEVAIDEAINEVDKFQSVTEWWKNPSELFASLKGDKISLYHTKPSDRLELTGRLSNYSSSVGIFASFKTGISVSENGNMVPQHAVDANPLSIGIFGWTGSKHMKVGDFKGDEQNAYRFLDVETVQELDSRQKVCLRIAQEVLAEIVDIETVDIPDPEAEYSDRISLVISRSVVRELLGRELKTERVGIPSARRTPSYRVTKIGTPISILTKTDFHRILRAANISESHQALRIEESVESLQQSEGIGSYIEGVKVEKLAKRFNRDILNYRS